MGCSSQRYRKTVQSDTPCTIIARTSVQFLFDNSVPVLHVRHDTQAVFRGFIRRDATVGILVNQDKARQ